MAKITFEDKNYFAGQPFNQLKDSEVNEIKTSVNALYGTVPAFAEAGDSFEFMGRTYGVVESATGRLWLDRNLGASQVATASDDADAYGDLYQWGRFADGHQQRGSDTTATLATSNDTGHGKFITIDASPNDWRNPQNDDLWQADTRINLLAPTGWRLPTEAEWEEEIAAWATENAVGAFASPLKLPVAGYRLDSNGSLNNVGSRGYYYSATVDGSNAGYLYFHSSFASMYSSYRAYGCSVRLIKDE